MLIQGSLITAIASFMASFGLFRIYYIIPLAFLGNLIPDLIFFYTGRYMRKKAVEEFIHKLGFNKKRILLLENGLNHHLKKSIFLIKTTPFMPLPGITLAGFLKIPFKRFFSISILVDLITITISVTIGFYSGLVGGSILRAFRLQEYLLPLLIIFVAILVFLTKIVYHYLMSHIRELINSN